LLITLDSWFNKNLNVHWKSYKKLVMNREEVLQILRLHQDELKNLGVKSLELFGSVARNEANSDSDVDLLAELLEPMTLLQFISIKQYIEDLLNCSVDLGTKDTLHELLRETVIKQTIYVF
jgi:predicted nucleotidyltransferase